MKPSELRRHLETKHSQHAKKDAIIFQRHKNSLKCQRLDVLGSFHQEHAAVIQASFEVALEIAKQKMPHLIGETLIKSCLLKSAKLVLGNASAAKLGQISLYNNTIQRRIADMFKDVKALRYKTRAFV